MDVATIGNYQVIDKLGVGGMGSVFLAKHTLIGRLAAIKVLNPEYCHNKDIVDRFFNEARAATSIDHPGIVEIYDYGLKDDNSAYIVMEYLKRFLRKNFQKLRCQRRRKKFQRF